MVSKFTNLSKIHLVVLACLVGAVSQVILTAAEVPPQGVSSETVGEGWTCDADLEGGASNSRDQKVDQIITVVSAIAGMTDATLAQLPAASTVVIPTIQAAMIFAIGAQYGCYMEMATALSLAAWFGSDYLKTSMLKESIGWIPIAGNIIKATMSATMTFSIGRLSKSTLRCPARAQELFSKALQTEPDSDGKVSPIGSSMRALFHSMTHYLLNGTALSMDKDAAAKEALGRISQLFWVQGQAELLEQVAAARVSQAPEELLKLIRVHTWNLEVVEAALLALQEFPGASACIGANFIAEQLWVSSAASSEAKLVAASHLAYCWSFLDQLGHATIVQTAAGLVVSSRRSQTPTQNIQTKALHLMEHALQRRDGPEEDVSSKQAYIIDSLINLPDVLAALFASLIRGEAAACTVLRSLLDEVHLSQESRQICAAWASVRHLQQLDRGDLPPGSELCSPALRYSIVRLLTLPEIPIGTETSDTSSQATLSASSSLTYSRAGATHGVAGLESALAGIVGQHCVVDRLIRSPGYARLKHKGMWRNDMPLVLLLTGPSGTGKTMLARSLAEGLLGKSAAELEAQGRFRTFHMNLFSLAEDQKTFFGPPKGIQGNGDLPELIKEWPDAVVLLDEIEKAHPSFARALLKVFGEHGAVYDPKSGKDYPTANVTFVLTSNLGKDLISQHPLARAKLRGVSVEGHDLRKGGDTDPDCSSFARLRQDVNTWLREPHISGRDNFFRESEIRSRLTDVLPFLPFGPQEVESAVRGFLHSEARIFSSSPRFSHLILTWDPAVVPYFAAEYIRQPEEGLRAVNVQLQAQVRDVVEAAMDTELLEKRGRLLLRLSMLEGSTYRLDASVISSSSSQASRAQDSYEDSKTPSGWLHWGSNLLTQMPVMQKSTTLEMQLTATSLPSSSGNHMGDIEWQYDHSWDWQLLWDQFWEVLWEWRVPLALTGVMLLAALSPSFMSMMAASPSSAAVTAAGVATPVALAGSSTAAPAVVATAAAVSSGVLALLQVAGSTGAIAVPVITFALAWQKRQYIVAFIWALVALKISPWIAPCWRILRDLRCADSRSIRSSHPSLNLARIKSRARDNCSTDSLPRCDLPQVITSSLPRDCNSPTCSSEHQDVKSTDGAVSPRSDEESSDADQFGSPSVQVTPAVVEKKDEMQSPSLGLEDVKPLV